MTEPSSTAATIIGLKYGSIIAGSVGGIISLKYIDGLNNFGRVLAVLSGAAVAGYGTPVLDSFLQLGSDTENAIAFFFGLTAMNIIPGMIRISELFRSDPLGFIRKNPIDRNHEHDN